MSRSAAKLAPMACGTYALNATGTHQNKRMSTGKPTIIAFRPPTHGRHDAQHPQNNHQCVPAYPLHVSTLDSTSSGRYSRNVDRSTTADRYAITGGGFRIAPLAEDSKAGTRLTSSEAVSSVACRSTDSTSMPASAAARWACSAVSAETSRTRSAPVARFAPRTNQNPVGLASRGRPSTPPQPTSTQPRRHPPHDESGGTRTHDPRIKSALLYQLSYRLARRPVA